jgi:tetratricopeptide (TPR) repeat protein
MGTVRKSAVECLKQLLPNLAASGLWGSLAVLAVPGGLPLAVGLGCVAAYLGLTRLGGSKSDDEEQHDLAEALRVVRGQSKDATRELAAVGYQLQYNFENVHLRLTGVDRAVEELSAQLAGRFDQLDAILERYFNGHRDRFDDLCFFLEVNFDALRPFLAALPDRVDDLRRDIAGTRVILDGVAATTNRTEDKVDQLLQMMMEDQRLRSVNELLRTANGSLEIENRSLRESSREALRSIIDAANYGDAQARQAIVQYEQDRDVERFKSFFDRFTRAADDIADRSVAKSVDRHRQRSALMYTVGDINRAVDSLERILRFCPTDLDAITRLGHVHLLRGNLEKAEAHYRQVLDLAGDDEAMKAVSYGNLGIILKTRGDLDGAEAMHRKALAIDEELGRLADLSGHYGNLGVVLQARSDWNGAEAMHRKAMEIDKNAGRLDRLALDYGNLGIVLRTRGDLDEAEAMHSKALAIHEKLNRLEGMALDYGNLGIALRTRGDLDGAEVMHRKAMAIHEKLVCPAGTANQYRSLGIISHVRGDFGGAEAMHRRALAIHEKLGALANIAADHGNLGIVLEAQGDLDGAEAMHSKALAIYERLGALGGIASGCSNLGSILGTRGDLNGAEAKHREALAIHEKLGVLGGVANDYGNLGIVLEALGDLDGAEAMHRKALAIEEKLGRPEGMANQYANLGVVLQRRGDSNAARTLWTSSRELFIRIGARHMADRVQDLIDWLPSS